jgi:hypothetical protein
MYSPNRQNRRLEAAIEKRFCDWLKLEPDDWQAIKIHRIGWPDRLILGPFAIIFFIEFKRPGEYVRRIQRIMHELLRKLGFKVYVCKSFPEAKAKVHQHIQAEILAGKIN